jgi:inosine/xanthosine triphosphatase
MQIAVGSGNPVKRDATDRVFPDASVVAEAVPSGVSEQPIGRDETRRGARNRAERALRSGSYDLGVGLEGGVAGAGSSSDESVAERSPSPTDSDGLYLIMWGAVTDGDRWGVGGGPSYPLPASIAERIRDGEELGPVMDDVLGASNVAQNQGAAGALTAGRTSRTDALAAAVAAAAGPFLTDLY